MYSYLKGALHATVLIAFYFTAVALDNKCTECEGLKERLHSITNSIQDDDLEPIIFDSKNYKN